jgi:hypothetical protein
MEDKNFTIIEDIFDNDVNNDNKNDILKKDYSFLRTLDSNSVHPYQSDNLQSLSYNEDMIKNKLSRQMNPRSMNHEYNSLNSSNRILPSNFSDNNRNIINNTNNNIKKVLPQPHTQQSQLHISCRNIYEHIENCPMCNKYYKQSNRSYILVIVFLVLIILLLLRQK